ncbi:MAG: sigma-70 family RNA polymerase sigma factor [Bacteroidales bacterium]
MSKNYTLNVYNTASGEYEDVEVTEEVYNIYRRTGWNMDKNDAKHSANSTPFSSLIGGDDGVYENFSEFINDGDNPLHIMMDKLSCQMLRRALDALSDKEYCLISAIYIGGKSEREYAEETGIPPMTIHDRKVRILKKIKKFMDFE